MFPRINALLERSQTRKEGSEDGSLILDILIGMAIFALIAIIAVSAIGQYRARAYKQTTVSDVTALATAMEAEFTDTGTYTDPALTLPKGITLSKNVTPSGFQVHPGGESFTLCTVHDRGAWTLYNSATGGVSDSGVDEADRPAECDGGTPPGTGPGGTPPVVGAATCPTAGDTMTMTWDAWGDVVVDLSMRIPSGSYDAGQMQFIGDDGYFSFEYYASQGPGWLGLGAFDRASAGKTMTFEPMLVNGSIATGSMDQPITCGPVTITLPELDAPSTHRF